MSNIQRGEIFTTVELALIEGLNSLSISGPNQGIAKISATTFENRTFSGGSGGAVWGDITGTLSNQTDLQTALNAKLSLAGGTMSGQIVVPAGSLNGTPAISATGDLTSGWNYRGSGQLDYQSSGTRVFILNSTGITGNGSGVFKISNASTSATVPNLIPNNSDTTTGIGASASGIISFITGATTKMEVLSASNAVTIGGGTTATELRFLEPSASGTNYTAFKVVAQSANITYTLPATVGGTNTYLKDVAGDGVLSWSTVAGGGDVSKVGTPVNNQVGVWTGDGTIEGDAALTFDTATDLLSTVILNLSSLTASEIVITDGSKNLVSAAVATYPSLTELTYLKGVTSTIQTQFTGKANTALSNLASVAINTTLVSDTDNTDALGTTAIAWSDLFLGSGAVIAFNSAPSTPDITITHSADTLTFAGGTIALGTATGNLTGNVTGNVSGTAATVTTAAQPAITSVGTLTILDVDNININGNTISSTAGTDLLITPLAGQQLILDGTIEIDAGVVTGITSLGVTGTRVTAGFFTDLTVTNAISGSITGNAGTATAVAVGGITGLGTGVATALAINVGSAGAFVTFNGALGTPSSGTVTNLTGTASININGTVGATTPTTIVGTTIQANTSFLPDADGGAALGSATLGFSILGLASASTINFANGNVVLTHSSGILTMGTGEFRITTVGTNGTSVPTLASTSIFTNKTMIATTNVVEEMTTTADSATPTPTGGSLRNFFSVTALAQAATFAAPSGTPANNNVLTIRILDNGTARALSWNAIYRASTDLALPTTTTLSKTMYLNFRYNSASSTWDFVAQTNGF